MERAGENRRLVVGKPVPSVRDMGSRRALRDINNLVGAPPYPCAIAKKPMLEKSGRDEQEPALVSRRPVTRRFAAFLGSEEHPGHQATATDAALLGDDPQKKPIPDGTIDADVESCESADDTDMDEIERKEKDESIMDIDGADSGNPLAATEKKNRIGHSSCIIYFRCFGHWICP